MRQILFFLLLALPRIALGQEGEAPPASAALQSTGRASHWKNWVFAGAALGAAAIGMTFIILNQGTEDR